MKNIIDNNKIKEILIREHYVTPEDIAKAEDVAKKEQGSFIEYLIREGYLTSDLVGQAVAESFGVPYADLNGRPPSREQVLRIPEAIARQYFVVIFMEDATTITFATDAPSQEGLTDALEKALTPQENALHIPKKFIIAYATSEDIETTFIHYRQTLETRFIKILEAQKRIAPGIIEEIIDDALLYRASDIHFEPQEKEVRIRFRIDGVLHESGRIPKAYYENILNRIKVQAHLRIDEHFSAQDGAIRYVRSGTNVDMRVSIAPMLDGEKVVIRLLSEYVRSFALMDLGLSREHGRLLQDAAKKPFGMILVTGPTGSGKTTTLYALVKTLHRPGVNITTVEDPVEYRISGVNQIQVNPRTNLTFAQGLRSIVRQDPNIILVGEIRDKETAEIAVNAALTGHLLLSTFHANDAATAIPRLLNMAIEPFLLASTLELVIAQRLARRICESCRVSNTEMPLRLKEYDMRRFAHKQISTFYYGKGCNACNHTGYKGRIGIFECIGTSPEMQELILKNPTALTIWEHARREGSRTLFEDGLEKVKAGITTLEELFRVAAPPRFHT